MTDELWRPVGTPAGEDRWVGQDTSERFPVYTRGNAGEVYPEVFTPLSFSVAAESAERAMRNAVLTSGLVRPEELADVPMTTAVGSGVFGGYAYLNLSIQRLASARMPGGKATDADVNYLGVGDPPPYVPDPNERNLRASMAGLRYVWKVLKTDELPELAADQRKVDRFLAGLPDPATAEDRELRESVRAMMPMFGDLFERHLVVSLAAGIAVAVVSNLCEQKLDDPLLASRLLSGLGDVDSAAPSIAMWRLSRDANASPPVTALFDAGPDGLELGLRSEAETDESVAAFVAGFDDLLEDFGSRGPNEWDTAFDTWETDPSLALTLIDRMRAADDSHDPTAQHGRLAAEAAALEQECLGRLKGLTKVIFRRAVASARFHSRSRERSKTTVVRAIHGARLRAMELDRRLVERSGGQRGDLWFLLDEEVDDYMADPAAKASTIAERRDQHRRLAERIPPFFFDRNQPPLDEWARRDAPSEDLAAGSVLTGLPGCPGKATGRARVVTHPGDPRGLAPGEVLVAPLTDP
ncbi:MAG: hypothetical protein AAFO29_00445, partial [Actinomycetota bacterium]